MQGGLPSVRLPDGSLNRSTAGAGNDVFRGHRLPPDMVGDYFYGETVARIVRRLRPVKADGLTQMRNVYPLSEFIRSTDPLFRPVDMTTAPDGTMYITDMYRGIIQQATWSGRGTYLRRKIEQYQLDKVYRHGRIWRLTYDGIERDRDAAADAERDAGAAGRASQSSERLVARHRAAAARAQAGQVGGAGAAEARGDARREQSARAHSRAVDARRAGRARRVVRARADEGRRSADARAGDSRQRDALQGRRSHRFAADYRAAAKDRDADVAIQAMLTSKLFNLPDLKAIVESAQAANKARGVQVIGTQILNPAAANAGRGGGGGRGGPPPFTRRRGGGDRHAATRSTRSCASPVTAPTAAARRRTAVRPARSWRRRWSARRACIGHRDYVIKTLLHGMTGPLDGKTYPAGVMMPLGANNDRVDRDHRLVRAQQLRQSRHRSSRAADVARVRAATAARKAMWTPEELEASLPKLLLAQPTWKVTASHNAAAARRRA